MTYLKSVAYSMHAYILPSGYVIEVLATADLYHKEARGFE